MKEKTITDFSNQIKKPTNNQSQTTPNKQTASSKTTLKTPTKQIEPKLIVKKRFIF